MVFVSVQDNHTNVAIKQSIFVHAPLKCPITISKRKVLADCFVSTIEAILAGSERVKGHASKD